MLPSRFVEGKCLVNCDACEYFSVDFRSGHLMRSVDDCSEDEVSLFGVIAFVSIFALIFRFGCFNISANSVFDTHILKALLKWCGK